LALAAWQAAGAGLAVSHSVCLSKGPHQLPTAPDHATADELPVAAICWVAEVPSLLGVATGAAGATVAACPTGGAPASSDGMT
jgi:hypothetical protein